MRSVEDIKLGYHFDTPTIRYSFDLGLWGGYANYIGANQLIFDASSATTVSSSWVSSIKHAFEQWGKYTGLTIEPAKNNTPNVYLFC